jgi:hypothetical protein
MADASNKLSEELIEASKKPLTAKDRVVGIVIALVLIGLCIGMWIRPDILPVESSDLGRGGRRVVLIVEFVWSRGIGAILGLVGLLVIYGSLTKPSAPKAGA